MQPRDSRSLAKDRALWARLASWYGTRFGETYGPTPPDDWRDLILRTPADVLERALTMVRTKHTTFPPTLPEFERAIGASTRVAAAGATTAERLAEFAISKRSLTWSQRRGMRFIGGEGGVTCVVFPADGASPEFRVMASELERQSCPA